jgi:hypothetical protein
MRSRFSILLAALLAIAVGAIAVLLVGGSEVVAEEEQGEFARIQARRDWFARSRTDGISSQPEARTLRATAALETAQAIAHLRRARSAGQTPERWRSIGPAGAHFPGWKFTDVSGRITALARDANGTLYVGGAAGGAWKSVDDGASWVSLLDLAPTQSIGALAIDPNDARVLWAGTGDYNVMCEGYFGVGLLRSEDGGASWQLRNGTGPTSLDSISSFAAIVVDPRDSRHVLAGATYRGCRNGSLSAGGIFATQDGGITWTERLGGVAVHSLVQDPQDRRVFWAATESGVYKSDDNGVRWTRQTASSLPGGATGRTELAVAPSDGRIVYALFSGGTTGPELWRTLDGGATWTRRSTGSNACDGQCNYNMTLAVDPFDPQIIYRGTVRLFKSSNGGATWEPLIAWFGPDQAVHQDIQELLLDRNRPDELLIGSDGGVWRSRDRGLSFQNLNSNLELTMFYGVDVHPGDREQICGGTQDNSSLARVDPGNVWRLQLLTGDGLLCQIDPLDPAFVYVGAVALNGPAVFRSQSGLLGDFNEAITTPDRGVDPTDRWPWVPQYLLDPAAPRTLFLASHRVYRSFDRGDRWEQVGPADLSGDRRSNVSALEIHRHFSSVVLAGTQDGRVWRSVDYGTRWEDVSAGLPLRYVNDLAGDPTDATRFYAVLGGFNTAHLWEWNEIDGWSARGRGLPNTPANSVVMISRNTLFVGTDVGVFRSQDGGHNFEPFMEGLPQGVVVTDLKYSATLNTLTAATYGRSAWQISLDAIATQLLLDSVDQPLVELRGDGDGFIDAGESFELTPRLKNVGGTSASGVSGRLSTATPLVTIEAPTRRQYAEANPGVVIAPATPFVFSVSEQFPCGGEIVFDLTEISSELPAGHYDALPEILRVRVADRFGPAHVERALDEDFDPAPARPLDHSARPSPRAECSDRTKDEWKLRRKDGSHRRSAHYGRGRNATYSRNGYGWFYPAGKDSTQDAGISIPSDATSAVLTITHWFSTGPGADGGQVLVDAVSDGLDNYALVTPVGGYTGPLRTGSCNPLEGQLAFSGNSGGWITTRFDLSRFRGRQIHLALVFGSDSLPSPHEGWYVDKLVLETTRPGEPSCSAATGKSASRSQEQE